MFGLTLEKLIVIGIIAAVVIGPEPLPRYTTALAQFIRNLRDVTATTKARAESELGVPINTDSWREQVRRYDPRVVVKDALTESTASTESAASTESTVTGPGPVMREQWVVVGGSSGHPVRRRVPAPTPVDDPVPAGDPVPTDDTEGTPPKEPEIHGTQQ